MSRTRRVSPTDPGCSNPDRSPRPDSERPGRLEGNPRGGSGTILRVDQANPPDASKLRPDFSYGPFAGGFDTTRSGFRASSVDT